MAGSRDRLLLNGADAADKIPGEAQAFAGGGIVERQGSGRETIVQRVVKLEEWKLVSSKLQLSTSSLCMVTRQGLVEKRC